MSVADDGLPNVASDPFDWPTGARFAGVGRSIHAPRFVLLYGSLRERSYSKLLTLEAARLLRAMGGEVRVFDPAGLPLPDSAPDSHPKVRDHAHPSAQDAQLVHRFPTSPQCPRPTWSSTTPAA